MEIQNIKLKIPKEEVLKRLGYKECVTEKSNIHLIDEQIEEAYSLIDVKAVYEDFDLKITDSSVSFVGGFLASSVLLAKRLKNCSKATIFLVTIGEEISSKTGDITIDTIRDAIGSEAVEELANAVNKIINQHVKLAGSKPLARYSVGYGDWDISDQSKVLKALKADFVNISESHIMYPKKTITAVIGWE